MSIAHFQTTVAGGFPPQPPSLDPNIRLMDDGTTIVQESDVLTTLIQPGIRFGTNGNILVIITSAVIEPEYDDATQWHLGDGTIPPTTADNFQVLCTMESGDPLDQAQALDVWHTIQGAGAAQITFQYSFANIVQTLSGKCTLMIRRTSDQVVLHVARRVQVTGIKNP